LEPERKAGRKRAAGASVAAPWDMYEKHLRPTHRLFISIDAIGSTKLKTDIQEKHPKDPGKAVIWGAQLLAFLPEAYTLLLKNFRAQIKSCTGNRCEKKCILLDSDKNPDFFPWKYVGDEVVMVADLRCNNQPYFFIEALRATLNEFNAKFAKTRLPKPLSDDARLQFKGAAWIAGFPVTNIEVHLPGKTQQGADEDSESAHPMRDFLGPSIDLGFRLGKYASKSRLVLSTSLAYLFHQACTLLSKKFPVLYSGGKVHIKGAVGDEHHLFWISPTDDNAHATELRHEPGTRELADFFTSLYGDNRPFIEAPYSREAYYPLYEKAVEKQRKLPHSPYYGIEPAKDGKEQDAKSAIDATAVMQDLKQKTRIGS